MRLSIRRIIDWYYRNRKVVRKRQEFSCHGLASWRINRVVLQQPDHHLEQAAVQADLTPTA
jgi:hypothetical protein